MVNKIFNKVMFVAVVSILFVIGVGVAYTQPIPNPGHGGDIILVSVDGFSMTLQEAINAGVLIDGASATKSYTTQIPNPGHNADKVWVSVDGSETTLQNAISTTGLCGSSSNSYSGNINTGHLASEVLVSIGGSEMTLQNAIDSGEFCIVYTYSWVVGTWSVCPVPCGGTQTRSVLCKRSDGTTVADSYCTGTKPASSQDCTVPDGTSCGTTTIAYGDWFCAQRAAPEASWLERRYDVFTDYTCKSGTCTSSTRTCLWSGGCSEPGSKVCIEYTHRCCGTAKSCCTSGRCVNGAYSSGYTDC